jgi:hypothetical protein
MGFFKDYRETRARLTAAESIATLSAMERLFQGGRKWTQGAYHRMNGNKCLVGAAQSVPVGAINDARYWLRQAIVELHPAYAWLPVMQIEAFNDSHSFAEVARVIERAKKLAAASARPAHVSSAPAPAAEILPPSRRPALMHQPESERPTIKLTMRDLERVAVKRRD